MAIHQQIVPASTPTVKAQHAVADVRGAWCDTRFSSEAFSTRLLPSAASNQLTLVATLCCDIKLGNAKAFDCSSAAINPDTAGRQVCEPALSPHTGP
jgi:hypothetical protein